MKNEIKNEMYNEFLNKLIRKNKMDILKNPFGFIRGIPMQLAEDVQIIFIGSLNKSTDKKTLKRLKYICEYIISKKSKRRIAIDNNTNASRRDIFTVYEERLEEILLLL